MSSNDELQEWYAQRDQLNGALELDPDNDELLLMKEELNTQIAELEAAAVPAKAAPPPPPEETPKWDKAKHPAFQKQSQQSTGDEPVQVTFKQNDLVLARWPKDKQFYEARITSITGSSADPVYYVKYTKYDEHASVRRYDIKPLMNPARKRKADDSAPASQPSVITSNSSTAAASSNIISAPSTVDPTLAAKAKKELGMDGQDGAGRPGKALRQMPKSKQLNNSKNSWQSFQKKQGGKKDSMFRTTEGNPNARVGFTGSGHEMRKDAARKRHMYNRDEDDDGA